MNRRFSSALFALSALIFSLWLLFTPSLGRTQTIGPGVTNLPEVTYPLGWAQPVVINLPEVTGAPDAIMQIPISLNTGGRNIGAVALDIGYNPGFLSGAPSAIINPAIGEGTDTDRLLISSMPAAGIFRLAIIPNYNHATSIQQTIPDGIIAYFIVHISSSVSPGSSMTLFNTPSSCNPESYPAPTIGSNGEISIASEGEGYDQDGDGLSNDFEILKSKTDPFKWDSDGDGISDADEDLDEDGFPNKEEQEGSSDPLDPLSRPWQSLWQVPLSIGWNCVGTAVDLTDYSAQTVCDDIASQNGNVTEIDKFAYGIWSGHICGLPFNNFPIESGKGYFVYSSQEGIWTQRGHDLSSYLQIPLFSGWNFISLPKWAEGLFDAQGLLDELNAQGCNCQEIDQFVNGIWEAHVNGIPLNNFPIIPGRGYGIKCIGPVMTNFTLGAQESEQNVYHVAKTGNDENPGTEELPWLTVQHAVDTIGPGDTVYIHSGVYNENVLLHKSGRPGAAICYSSAPEEFATVTSLEFAQGSAYLHLTQLTITGFSTLGVFMRGDNHHINLNSLTVSGGETGIQLTHGTQGECPAEGPVSNILIDYCLIQESLYPAISCSPGPGNDLTLRNLEIRDAGKGLRTSYTADGIHIESGQNILIEECYIHDNKGDGIDLNYGAIEGNAAGIVVRRNTVSQNYIDGIKLYAGGRLENNVFSGSGNCPVAVGIYPGTFEVINNTIAYNMQDSNYSVHNYSFIAGYPEDGVSAHIDLLLYNNIFAFNSNELMDGPTGIYIGLNVNLTEGYNLFWSREDGEIDAKFVAGDTLFTRTEIADGTWALASGGGTGDVTADPLFNSEWDFHLQEGSPAIDSGTSSEAPVVDIEGTARPQGDGYDIGAYEKKSFDFAPPEILDFEDGTVEGLRLTTGWKLDQLNDNYLLSSEGPGLASFYKEEILDQYEKQFDIFLPYGGLNLNFRMSEGGNYTLDISPYGVYLKKIWAGGDEYYLTGNYSYLNPDAWHTIKLVDNGGDFKFFIDGILELQYTDDDPLPPGTSAFETLYESYLFLDNFIFRPIYTNRKVIVSPLGEIENDVRYQGEIARFKIYYVNNTKESNTLWIFDKLDPNLKPVSIFNGGMYDEMTHSITWVIYDLLPGRGGFVEFEARIGTTDLIKNRGYIQIGGSIDPRTFDPYARTVIKTNTVTIKVCDRPEMLGWIPFDPSAKEGEKPRSYMKDETTMDTMVNFDIPGMYAHEVKVNGLRYQRLSIPDHATLTEIGKPEIPIVGQIIEVPFGVNFSFDIVKSSYITLDCYTIYPYQTPEIRQLNFIEGSRCCADKFSIDKSIYLTDGLFPSGPAKIEAEDIGVIRGHRVLFLKVHPIQYNPVTREIKAFSNIEVRINYSRTTQIEPVARRIESGPFEEMLQDTVLNYKDPYRFAREDAPVEESGCNYLIITPAGFYDQKDPNNPIMRLKDWKQRKGLKVRVVTTANIPGGATAANIRAYLQTVYDTWYPVPTYILLVGDSELIPTNYQTAHGSHNNTLIGTDLYYTTVDGTDYFPDIFIGRLSVDTFAQAKIVINKILNYERNAPDNANYYANTSLVCLFEDDTDSASDGCPEDGREDCTFRIIEFAEEIRDYLQNNGYTCGRIYDQSGAFAQGPRRYENNTALPNNLTIAGGFPWNGGTADIRNAINAGNFIVTFNGHGNRGGWGRPGFGNGDVGALTNGNLVPVVFSWACMNSWFDNETDANDLSPAAGLQGTDVNDESFSENFLRRDNAGAVAIVGATRISWGNNDFMKLGSYKAIWSDFDPNPPFGPGTLPDIQTGPLFKMGQIVTFSKVYMANYFAHDTERLQAFEMYHLFGDPEMPVWTARPVKLRVEHPEGIGSTGEQQFIVKVLDDSNGNPVQNAMVVLTRGSSIVSIKQTNPAGIAEFTLNAPSSGSLDLTVTAHNYRPYEKSIIVSASGAVINRLEPDNGIENQTFYVGGQNFSGTETVDIYFGNTLAKSKAANAGSFGQSGVENVSLKVPSPYSLGPVNILAHGRTSNRYAVDVFRVRSANPIDLYIYSQWDSTTWHLQPGDNPVWNNPEIQLYDAGNNPVQSNNLTVGHTYTIKANIHNDTDFDAQNVTVTFKWADFGLGQPDRVWNVIGDDKIDVAKHSAKEAEIQWAPQSTGHLCIIAEIYHIEDINDDNNKGQENCHVGPTSSPAKVSFTIWNPTDTPVAVHLELRQLNRTQQTYERPLWGAWIEHPDPQIIPPDGKTQGWVFIDPDFADAKTGEQAEFSLTGYINGRIIGGVNFIIIKR